MFDGTLNLEVGAFSGKDQAVKIELSLNGLVHTTTKYNKYRDLKNAVSSHRLLKGTSR